MRPPTPEAVKVQVREDGMAGLTGKAIAEKRHLSLSTVNRILAASNGRRQRRRVRTNGVVTITATPELVDRIWSGLSLENQAALINKLTEL